MSDYLIAALLILSAWAVNLHLDGAKEVRLLAKCNDRILMVDGQPLEYVS